MTDRESVQSLWCAVITQAIEDARAQASRNVKAMQARSQARDWLLKPNADFRRVCDLAGLEPSWVRAFAANEVAKADALPMKAPRVVMRFEFEGESLTVTEIVRRTGVNENWLRGRLNRGWSLQDSLKAWIERGAIQELSASSGDRRGERRAGLDENRVFSQ